MRLLQAIACAAVVLFGASTALATVSVANVTRDRDHNPDDFSYFISKSDCESSDTFKFPVVLTDIGDIQSFQVWIGENVDCTSTDARNGVGTQCRQLGTSEGSPQDNFTFSATAKAIVEAGIGATNCVDDDGSTTSRPVSIYFMLVRAANTNVEAKDAFVFDLTEIDLLGPKPPTNVSASPSDSAIELEYSVNDDSNTTGFRFYCDRGQLTPLEDPTILDTSSGTGGSDATAAGAGGGSAIIPFGGGLGGAGSGGGGDGGAGGTGDAGAASTGASVVAATSGDASSTATGAGGGGDFTCAATVLKKGATPNADWAECGSVESLTGKGVAKSLKNNREYAIAIVGVDQIGNVGVLSEVVCATPLPVTDFYEAYVDAGGQAGGGICSVALPGSPAFRWAFGALVVAGAGLALARRRSGRGGRA